MLLLWTEAWNFTELVVLCRVCLNTDIFLYLEHQRLSEWLTSTTLLVAVTCSRSIAHFCVSLLESQNVLHCLFNWAFCCFYLHAVIWQWRLPAGLLWAAQIHPAQWVGGGAAVLRRPGEQQAAQVSVFVGSHADPSVCDEAGVETRHYCLHVFPQHAFKHWLVVLWWFHTLNVSVCCGAIYSLFYKGPQQT